MIGTEEYLLSTHLIEIDTYVVLKSISEEQ